MIWGPLAEIFMLTGTGRLKNTFLWLAKASPKLINSPKCQNKKRETTEAFIDFLLYTLNKKLVKVSCT